MNQNRAFAAMIDHPTLVKRPVLESDEFIAVGFSEKRFTEYLSEID
jgi:arsenate reductase-like glutaredoxin family protein